MFGGGCIYFLSRKRFNTLFTPFWDFYVKRLHARVIHDGKMTYVE